ncbi:DUF2721 domain-containing protein [Roseivirga misakiensis]|uniref:DUF2721 domain-containing protein n=1 Tax=Roseivirga misakiensis TaxID=1563681 RepID=A0A1E5T4P3_9BACT|nr:DUF2721 domain-containing protein [Roseivirga misakiensis]OEK06257.1 hypothetical protein BFP71_00855 [Roseivirga misakiensis]
MDNWVIPLTLLPGIGMMIMSTSNLATAISTEINNLLERQDCKPELIQKKISQMSLLNVAMVCLYISAAVFAVAGLIEGIFELRTEMHDGTLHQLLLVVGIAALVIASLLLITFSIRAVRIKHNQFLNSIHKD